MFEGALKSKTVWLGTALIILTEVATYMPEFQELITPDVYGGIVKAIGLAVIILRVVTTKPLAEK